MLRFLGHTRKELCFGAQHRSIMVLFNSWGNDQMWDVFHNSKIIFLMRHPWPWVLIKIIIYWLVHVSSRYAYLFYFSLHLVKAYLWSSWNSNVTQSIIRHTMAMLTLQQNWTKIKKKNQNDMGINYMLAQRKTNWKNGFFLKIKKWSESSFKKVPKERRFLEYGVLKRWQQIFALPQIQIVILWPTQLSCWQGGRGEKRWD